MFSSHHNSIDMKGLRNEVDKSTSCTTTGHTNIVFKLWPVNKPCLRVGLCLFTAIKPWHYATTITYNIYIYGQNPEFNSLVWSLLTLAPIIVLCENIYTTSMCIFIKLCSLFISIYKLDMYTTVKCI